MRPFLGNFWEHWATYYSAIWSHWLYDVYYFNWPMYSSALPLTLSQTVMWRLCLGRSVMDAMKTNCSWKSGHNVFHLTVVRFVLDFLLPGCRMLKHHHGSRLNYGPNTASIFVFSSFSHEQGWMVFLGFELRLVDADKSTVPMRLWIVDSNTLRQVLFYHLGLCMGCEVEEWMYI